MVRIETLANEGKVSKIRELERYLNFFENSYKDNLSHCKRNVENFPRWSIISGYEEFLNLATDLSEAKKESNRNNTQELLL